MIDQAAAPLGMNPPESADFSPGDEWNRPLPRPVSVVGAKAVK